MDVVSAIPYGATVLDVGTGAGCGPRAIQPIRPDIQWSGMDFSSYVVEWTRKHSGVKWAKVLVADIRDGLSMEDNSFDIVMSTELLEHLESPAAAVAEFARVARNQVIVTTPASGKAKKDSPYHVWKFSPDDILGLLKPYGETRVAITRENRQILGVCFLGDSSK